MIAIRILLLLSGIALLAWAYYEVYRQKVMAATPTIGAGDVGNVIDSEREVRIEVQGTAAAGPSGVLRSPLTETPCVWHRTRISRKYTQWETDSDGRRKQVTKEETVYDSSTGKPFWVRDVSGQVLLYPDGQRPDGARRSLNRYEGVRGPLYRQAKSQGIGLPGFANSTKGYRFQEWVLAEGVPIYALGAATLVRGQPAIRKSSRPPYIISTYSEQEVARRSRLIAAVFSVLGTLLVVGTVVWWIAEPTA